MESIYILIPISIVLVFIIGGFLWWSSKSGQFDDLDGPGYRIIMDDDETEQFDDDETKTADNTKQSSDTVPVDDVDSDTSNSNNTEDKQ